MPDPSTKRRADIDAAGVGPDPFAVAQGDLAVLVDFLRALGQASEPEALLRRCAAMSDGLDYYIRRRGKTGRPRKLLKPSEHHAALLAASECREAIARGVPRDVAMRRVRSRYKGQGLTRDTLRAAMDSKLRPPSLPAGGKPPMFSAAEAAHTPRTIYAKGEN